MKELNWHIYYKFIKWIRILLAASRIQKDEYYRTHALHLKELSITHLIDNLIHVCIGIPVTRTQQIVTSLA